MRDVLLFFSLAQLKATVELLIGLINWSINWSVVSQGMGMPKERERHRGTTGRWSSRNTPKH